MNQNQLKKGTKVEAEHRDVVKWLRNYEKKYDTLPKNRTIYKHIAKTHLKENPNYYKKLKKMGL